MRTFAGLDALEPDRRGAAVTIGTFDGVHLGHRALIAETVSVSNEDGLTATAVTWDRHPFATLRKDQVPPLLSSPERRAELLDSLGIESLAVLAFDDELSSWPPERFVSDVLAKRLGARVVIAGDGWRFGHGATGDIQLLRRLGRELGFKVVALDLAEAGGGVISSSRVRGAVADGDMELAGSLLGRPYDMDGIVVRGAGRGRALGYPTANLNVDASLVVPARGAYAGRARTGDVWYSAAISVGVAPTFGGDSELTIEAYLLDFDADIYGRVVRVEFWRHLHDDLRFETVEDLIAQIERDVEATRSLTGA